MPRWAMTSYATVPTPSLSSRKAEEGSHFDSRFTSQTCHRVLNNFIIIYWLKRKYLNPFIVPYYEHNEPRIVSISPKPSFMKKVVIRHQETDRVFHFPNTADRMNAPRTHMITTRILTTTDVLLIVNETVYSTKYCFTCAHFWGLKSTPKQIQICIQTKKWEHFLGHSLMVTTAKLLNTGLAKVLQYKYCL